MSVLNQNEALMHHQTSPPVLTHVNIEMYMVVSMEVEGTANLSTIDLGHGGHAGMTMVSY